MDSQDTQLHRLEVPKRFAGKRFDRVLRELLPDLTGSQLQRLVRRGRVKVDGKKVVRSNFSLRGGEAVTLRLAAFAAPAAPELDVVYGEDEFVVVNKPAGMLTHPAGEHRGDSVSELAVLAFGALPCADDDGDRPGIVHRLDRETSGLLVLARTQEAMEDLRRQFRERSVTKRYLAMVYGSPREDTFKVDLAMAPVPGNKDLQRLDAVGRSASTEFSVLERARGFALVECRPSTGRRHQLRVHLSSVGHPIVGDKMYRPPSTVERVSGVRMQALHAQALAFHRPGDGELLEFEVAPPADFQDLWARLAH